MRLSDKRVKGLQALLKSEFGLDYSAEEAQKAGLAIMRFIVSKYRNGTLPAEVNNGNGKLNNTKVRKTAAS